MHGLTNAEGGINPFAFIFATYPVGSVCTCTDGSRTLRLRDTSGYGVFYPPYAGTWIVTATDPADPTKTDSDTVEITTEGQSVSVELAYELWLYRNGDECTDITGGWATKTSGGTVTKKEDNIYISVSGATNVSRWAYSYTANMIDVSKYDTLSVGEGITLSASGGECYWGLYNSLPTGYDQFRDAVARGNQNVTEIDISAISGEYYVLAAAFVPGTSSYYSRLTVREIKLL